MKRKRELELMLIVWLSQMEPNDTGTYPDDVLGIIRELETASRDSGVQGANPGLIVQQASRTGL